MLRAFEVITAGDPRPSPWEVVVLDSQERHIRRKVITLAHGDRLLVDLPKPVRLMARDCLLLEDGRLVEVLAADEDLLEIRAHDYMHLLRLAWHLGNRHLEAQIEQQRILIRPDHVIAHMLQQQGARVTAVREAFSPENGAYHGHAHDYDQKAQQQYEFKPHAG